MVSMVCMISVGVPSWWTYEFPPYTVLLHPQISVFPRPKAFITNHGNHGDHVFFGAASLTILTVLQGQRHAPPAAFQPYHLALCRIGLRRLTRVRTG
jgi:hypothetical protein